MDVVCGLIDSTSLSARQKKKLRERCRKAKIECDGYWCRWTAFGRLAPPEAYSKRGTITLCSQNGGVGDTTWWYLAHELAHQILGVQIGESSGDEADKIANQFQHAADLPCTQWWFEGKSGKPPRKPKKKKECWQ
jgi:hypothetical protein